MKKTEFDFFIEVLSEAAKSDSREKISFKELAILAETAKIRFRAYERKLQKDHEQSREDSRGYYGQ